MQLSDDVKFDKRLLDRHLNKGHVERKQVDGHLGELKDLAEQTEFIPVDRYLEKGGARREKPRP